MRGTALSKATGRHDPNAVPVKMKWRVAVGALSVAIGAVGATVVGARAIGALALGALAIGKLRTGKARFERLEIDELIVHKLTIVERVEPASLTEPNQTGS